MTDSTPSIPRPVLREVAVRKTPPGFEQWNAATDLPDHILRSEGYTSSGASGLFDLYDEMEQKDGHLFAVLQTRKNGVLGCPRKVIPNGDEDRSRELARFVENALADIPNFDQALLNTLDALGKGLSIQEIVWEARAGRIGIRALKSRVPGRFAFDDEGRLHLTPWDRAGVTGRAPLTAGASRPLPERKFLVFRFGALYETPWGRGLCSRAYWYWWFKKNNLKFWMIYNEKFGTPTVVGRYRPGASEDDRDQLFDVIESLQNDTGVTIPESVSVELLEAQRSGHAGTYRELADWCNDEISKIVLGATLTSGDGNASGSYALGQIHDRVRGDYIEADARALEDAVNSQIVRWLVDFNFGPDTPAPRWTIDTTRDDRLENDILVDRQLVEAGIALPERYFYEKYKRPAPTDDEPSLRFDDRNLYQYHLRFGVLTINEARARLGLPPVSWGDQQPRDLGGDNDTTGGLDEREPIEERNEERAPDNREV